MWYCTWKRRPSRRAADARRVRLSLERLEERAVPASLQPGPFGDGSGGPAVTTVYTESNNPAAGQNAVLAFHQNSDGTLSEIGSFNTGGTGQINIPKVIGPDDSSQEVVATPDGRFLFAVNQGSNSVSAFRIDPNGGLDLIGTFDSGGVQPDSIGLAGDKLYVSNRGDSAVGHPGTVAPNITGFRIDHGGSLTPIAGSTVTFPVDTSPSQNLITPNGKLLFADIFAVPGSTAPEGNTLAPFQIEGDGSLELAPGGNVGAPVTPPLLLGAAFNPNQPIIYAGLTAVNEVGVFTYDKSGQLTFVGDVPVQGAGPCWIAVSPDGQFLYTGDTGTDSVGVFSLADPLHPVQIQELKLAGPYAPPGSPSGTLQTNVFQIALSPDGHTLYAISQNTSPDGSFADGNQLHILSVAADGTLSEPTGPVLLSTAGVPGDAHPQGIAVVVGKGHKHDFDIGEKGGDVGTKGIGTSGTDAAAIHLGSLLSSGTTPDLSDLDLTGLAIMLAHHNQQSN
ncbi:MAG TPA: beta-propeller fold lactonase family protein [Gemmataceae bacterium]|nr:beta-propeller fold lactonase family protein [Gemmataceae bacterium]